MGRIVQFRRDLRHRLRRWHAFGATLTMLILGLSAAIGIIAYSQFATTDSGSAGLPRILGPKVSSQPIVGQASVVDGDTIEIHGTRIRLFGIDAPEGGQTCTVQGKAMPCGRRAAFALANRIGRQVVECRPKDEDRYGRVVAVCGVGGEDINAWMVAQGWALAYRYYSRDYVSQERSASKAKLGMWQGEFEPPWDWRQTVSRLHYTGFVKASSCELVYRRARRQPAACASASVQNQRSPLARFIPVFA